MIETLLRMVGIETQPFGHPASAAGRSPKWPAVRKAHLRVHSACCVSGLKADLDVHHVQPFHLYPELELDPANLRTVARPYHFLIGHLCNWSVFNADFDAMANEIRLAIAKSKRK